MSKVRFLAAQNVSATVTNQTNLIGSIDGVESEGRAREAVESVADHHGSHEHGQCSYGFAVEEDDWGRLTKFTKQLSAASLNRQYGRKVERRSKKELNKAFPMMSATTGLKTHDYIQISPRLHKLRRPPCPRPKHQRRRDPRCLQEVWSSRLVLQLSIDPSRTTIPATVRTEKDDYDRREGAVGEMAQE
ncbi:hypothetical protein QJS10_CPA02g00913 [Acorus calamus]|uniref:Uncharacterized protein n=1 Tax=Acorus calamus TaxID=4465 RepID=A0AAV9FAN3_ACOCL|nr:hypothetical protein QJS10_CPA02g00913 [Acorus calamus]